MIEVISFCLNIVFFFILIFVITELKATEKKLKNARQSLGVCEREKADNIEEFKRKHKTDKQDFDTYVNKVKKLSKDKWEDNFKFWHGTSYDEVILKKGK